MGTDPTVHWETLLHRLEVGVSLNILSEVQTCRHRALNTYFKLSAVSLSGRWFISLDFSKYI